MRTALLEALTRVGGQQVAVHHRRGGQAAGFAQRHLVEQGARGGDDALHGHGEQFDRAIGGDFEQFQVALGHQRGPFGAENRGGGRGLGDGAVEQARRQRRGEQRGHAARAGGFAEDGDIARVAAEGRGIVAHPAQGGDLVVQAQIRHEFVTERGQVEEAQRTQPVVDSDHDHIAGLGQPFAVVDGLGCGAQAERAAVQPHHDRAEFVARIGGGPDIEPQAVLAHAQAAVDGDEARRLRRDIAEVGAVADAGPGQRGLRRAEAIGAADARGVGNAAPHGDPAVQRSGNLTGSGFRDRHARAAGRRVIASRRCVEEPSAHTRPPRTS